MKLGYDNLDDAKSKLVSTFCYYKDRAVIVKHVGQHQKLEDPEDTEGSFFCEGVYMGTGRGFTCDIENPDFNCSDYNIGYLNLFNRAAWFYRVPAKQYHQGLKHTQVRLKASSKMYADINFQSGKSLCAMLENEYPKFSKAAELLKVGEASIVAFHKDFAMTMDEIHSDYLVEYKGTKIGFTNNLKDFQLMEEHKHLVEALKEVAK